MLNVTLRQLRYVDALARHGHFGHAADACAISQPALSMQVRDLEDALGATLFDRGPRHVRLTGFGEEFVARAREILQRIDQLDDLARSSRDQFGGRLRLGIIPTIAPYLLPRLMAGLSEAYPALDVHVRESLTATLIGDLSDGRLDAAIVALPISEPAFEEVALFTEEFVLVRPLAEADDPVPDAERLREMRLLLLEEGHCFRDQALDFCNMRGTRAREVMDGSSLSTLVQMVGAGIGVTLIPEMALPVETRSAAVATARFRVPRPARTVGLIWRRSSPLASRLLAMAEIVRGARQP